MSRAPKLWFLLFVLPIGALNAACSSAADSAAPAGQPNIVWIVPEDMNFELGAFGDPTPSSTTNSVTYS